VALAFAVAVVLDCPAAGLVHGRAATPAAASINTAMRLMHPCYNGKSP